MALEWLFSSVQSHVPLKGTPFSELIVADRTFVWVDTRMSPQVDLQRMLEEIENQKQIGHLYGLIPE